MTNLAQTSERCYKSDTHSDFLLQYDEYIRMVARKAIPHRLFPREILDLEIDDLTQSVRIKLWQMLEGQRPILNPKAYIYRIAYTGAIDIIRRHRHTMPLSLDEYGEIVQDVLLIALKQEGEALDPAHLFEEKETIGEYIRQVTDLAVSLPRQQRLAIICVLKDCLEDLRPFLHILHERGVNIEMIHWPTEKEERHRLKASVSMARKKLRSSLLSVC